MGTAAKPLRTDALRVAPPITPPSRCACAWGRTTITPSLATRAVSTAQSTTRRSLIISNCFGLPKRAPDPAATMIVHIFSPTRCVASVFTLI